MTTKASDRSESQAGELPFVSIVIPSRNERDRIEDCLESVAMQDYPADKLETIVVDGHSDDGTAEWLADEGRKRWPHLQVLDNPGQTAARGLNIGIRSSRGEVVVILSAHAEVAPDFVRENVRALAETGADVTGGPLESVGAGPVGQAVALAVSSPFGAADSMFRYSQRPQWVQSVAYGAYRREVFERVGLFDETLPRCIDDDFNYRLVDSGGRLWLDPKVRSRYHARSSFGALFRQYFNSGTWKTEVLRKQLRQAKPRHLGPALFVGAVAGAAALSPVSSRARLLLGGMLGTYAGVSLAVSAGIARERGPKFLALMPAAFACIHFGYGIGMWNGILDIVRGRRVQLKNGRRNGHSPEAME